MNTCCEYAYWCPTSGAVKCYAHGGFEQCCDREDLHECLLGMYGSEDGVGFGDGFICYRCGNYEIAGNPHGPPQPGFPCKTGPPRRGTLLDHPPASVTATTAATDATSAARLRRIFKKEDATADAEYERLHGQLDPKDPQFGNKVHELFQAAEIGGTGGLGKKIALLTYLVENELAPALPGAVKFHPEPVQMFSLVSVYMDDPQAIELLTTVLEYEVTKYPDDEMATAQAKAFLGPIEAMLEMDRKDPTEKSWQSGREWQPEAHAEREKAHRLFRLVELKAKRK